MVRRVEGGEAIDITVAGRLAARLIPVPVAPRRWNQWEDIAEVFDTPVDDGWESDRELVDQSVSNPWEKQS